MRILGALLAGGAARRFGADKALATLDGRPLAEHALAALAGCEAIVVCGRADLPGTFVADVPRAGLGPLGGICAALLHGAANRFDAVVSVPCDVPDLPADLIERLDVGPSFFAALPVAGLWPCALANGLRERLWQDDDRSMRRWAAAIGARAVALDRALHNINTPADLAVAERARQR